jgi:hypothetical protein
MRALLALCAFFFASIAWAQAAPPRRAAGRGPPAPTVPTARLTATWGDVTISPPPVHGSLLSAGTRVHVGRGGEAEVTLRNGTVLTFAGRGDAVLLAPIMRREGSPPIYITLLRHGAVRFRVGASAPRRPRFLLLSTGPASLALGRADGELVTDPSGRNTRVGVTRGRVRVVTPRGSTFLFARRGALLAPGEPPVTEPLPGRPVWRERPPERVVTAGAPVDVAGVYGLPSGHARRWRVELARDEAFRERVSTQVAPARAQRLLLQGVPPGRYFVRVSALSEGGVAGPASEAASFTVAAPTIDPGAAPSPGAPGRRARVVMPPGFHCAIDGMALARVSGAIPLTPGRAHALRCVAAPDAVSQHAFTIPVEQAGALAHALRLYLSPAGAGTLGITLRDAEGGPVPYADVRVEAGDGVLVEPVREAERRGEYAAALRWPRGLARTRVRVTVNGAVRFEEDVAPE